jgi:serine/threonine protein kinase
VWKNLFHPNILPLLGVSEVRSLPCIVTEWMPHGTIVNYLIENPTKNRFALVGCPAFRSHRSLMIYVNFRKLSDVAKGLKYLHSSEVVHGDLKGVRYLFN